MLNPEHERLNAHRQRRANWKHWGPYLSERAWGTVREDYSPSGESWHAFPHEYARSKAYRWGEDGLGGICDRNQYLCLALALWNGQDDSLKERLFGLSGPQGNHGEDVKEVYWYLDATPTHSYLKMLYKYPQTAFPYADLVAENARRSYHDPEYELLDTGAFAENRYFDVVIEYAKAAENDILMRVTATNHGPDTAPLWLLPTLWFRNTWSWGYAAGPLGDAPGKPRIVRNPDGGLIAEHPNPDFGAYFVYAQPGAQWLFTENETNNRLLYNSPNASPFVKDAFHRYLIGGEQDALNPAQVGTKAAALFQATLAPGEVFSVRLRLTQTPQDTPFYASDTIFTKRLDEATAFYAHLQRADLGDDARNIQRQALAGMIWTKQLYYLDIPQWLHGDPFGPPPARRVVRNADWEHLSNFDIISMPDKWEYPWYAAWDLAFHCIPLLMVDPDFAKRQLVLMTREWYMHPNGQLPAYEWKFDDVNPPVHAWGAWHTYKLDAQATGQPDRPFLEGIFQKLLLNFTWWVNRKDEDGNNVFQGGFLGLDNISVFDRSHALPTGGHIDQSDGTSWMGFYAVEMLRMALELAKEEPIYQDMASKFFEHYLRIADAMTNAARHGHALWDDEDGFFYDTLHLPDESFVPLRVRSLVGLMPLIAVEIIEQELLDAMPVFARRMGWFLDNRPELAGNLADVYIPGVGQRHLMSFLTPQRLRRILYYMLDENEFLSPYGVRSVSKYHEDNPYTFYVGHTAHTLRYTPAESDSGLFGGNSNWRGPVWFPVNYLLIEALEKYHDYYGARFMVECPTGSGKLMNLAEVAAELGRRLTRIFLRDENGRRAVYGGTEIMQSDPLWRDYILFYEYFNGDDGAGLGAAHQTGWTGLVAALLQRYGG
ncbi:MAG: MGH1-like glycoside hydrolase domain-containing protein [Anaerolineales bacterium]